MATAEKQQNDLEAVARMRSRGLTEREIKAALPHVPVRYLIHRYKVPVTRRRPDLPGETWKALPGYEDRYEVSDLGRVWSIWNPEFPRTGVLMRPNVDAKGYHLLTIWRDGRNRKIGVHRLVMWTFVGPQPRGIEVRHLDGNPANNRLSNLRYGTSSENAADKAIHGTDHNANKTHCIAGHPYSPENTYIRPSGGRTCRACKRARWHRDADEVNAARRQAEKRPPQRVPCVECGSTFYSKSGYKRHLRRMHAA